MSGTKVRPQLNWGRVIRTVLIIVGVGVGLALLAYGAVWVWLYYTIYSEVLGV